MKVNGGETALLGGVSRLPAYQQRPGQCQEQVNFLADPGVGLARRPGSVRLGELGLGIRDEPEYTDAESWVAVPWRTPTKNLTALIRRKARAAGATNAPIQVFNHDTNEFLPLTIPATDALFQELSAGGVSSCVPVGEYLLMAGNTVTVPMTTADAEAAHSTDSAVWVRGGDYDRTYTVTARNGAQEVTASYRTPPAAYPGQLDTTNIPWYIKDPAGGTEAVSYPLTVLQLSGGCTLRLPVWYYPSEATITGLVVKNDDGQTLVDVGAGAVTTPLQYGQTLGVAAELRLHTDTLGRRFTLSYTITFQIPGGGGTFTRVIEDSQLAVADTRVMGAAYIPTPVALGPTVAGYSPTTTSPHYAPIPAGQFYYNPAFSANYVYFGADAIGKSVTLTGTRDKVLANPDYPRAVADAEAAFQRKVTAWVLEASAKIQPAAIAAELTARLLAAGAVAWQYGTHVAVTADTITATDGKDNTLIRAVDREVSAVEDLTDQHHTGKVVHIKPPGARTGYYVKAEPKQPGQSGFVEVRWVESTPTVRQITGGIALCTVGNGGAFAAGTSALLSSILPGTHPDFLASKVGDTTTAPAPHFVGKRITLLALFQDRLLVGSGGKLSVSATGDFLNFWPSTLLTVPASDAFEVTAAGADSDVLRQAVLYGRDLVVFGEQRQYALSGRVAMSPTNASLATVSTVPNAASVQPQALGGLLFYVTEDERGVHLGQITPGADPNNPSAYTVSLGLGGYLGSGALEAAHRANPDTVYLRTSANRGGIFLFRFSDTERGRAVAGWSRWEFSSALGTVLGMRVTPEGVVVFFLRKGHANQGYLVADLCREDAARSPRPYLDSLRPIAEVIEGTGSVRGDSTGPLFVAYDSSSSQPLIGDTLTNATAVAAAHGTAGLWCGYEQHTEYVMTNPVYVGRDGTPNLTARLVLATITLYARDSSGMRVTWDTPWGVRSQNFLTRAAGDFGLIGQIPVRHFQQQIGVGRCTDDVTITLGALKWYPLTLTATEWAGQLHLRNARV